MSMGKRKGDRQPTIWVTTTQLPTAASQPFYQCLNEILASTALTISSQSWADQKSSRQVIAGSCAGTHVLAVAGVLWT
jgi:hypothetical protein